MRKILFVLLAVAIGIGLFQFGYRSGKNLAVEHNAADTQSTASTDAPIRMQRASSRETDRSSSRDTVGSKLGSIGYEQLPKEAGKVLADIAHGGPYDYPRDGITFQNRERLLPRRENGYYREFTVPTPGTSDRGARRIVTGGKPPAEYYWTDDHYRSFSRISDLP